MNELPIDACAVCGRKFKSSFRPSYRSFCRKCYDRSQLPCDHCGLRIRAATSAQNEGCCRDCYYEHARVSDLNDSDRKSAMEEFQSSAGISLPEAFIDFLGQHVGKQGYEHGKTGSKTWKLCTAANDRHGVSLADETTGEPFHSILVRFGNEHLAFAKTKQLADTDGGTYPISRLQECCAIGESDGDILFFDPREDFSVWCFWHDGAEVTKLASSFTDFISQVKLEFPERRSTPTDLLPMISDYAGRWVAKKSRWFTEIELSTDGRATVRYKSGSESYQFWRFVNKKKLGVYREFECEYEYEVMDKDTLYEPDLKATLVRSQPDLGELDAERNG